jgi:RNA polymerase sigma-70 factor (ECF subfamily)
MNSTDCEAELVRQAVSGDRAALLKLLGRSRQQLCQRVAHRIPTALRGVVDAEDVVQDAHVEVFRHIDTFELRDSDSFDRWIRTIALRKLRDAVRRQRAAKRGQGKSPIGPVAQSLEDSMIALLDLISAPGRTPSSVAARAEGVQAMQAAIGQLPEDYRKAVWLVHIEGRSVASVAKAMGRSEGAIRVLCHKARRRMRDILGSRSRFLSSSG